jgi:iron complex outermembrane receptor protein
LQHVNRVTAAVRADAPLGSTQALAHILPIEARSLCRPPDRGHAGSAQESTMQSPHLSRFLPSLLAGASTLGLLASVPALAQEAPPAPPQTAQAAPAVANAAGLEEITVVGQKQQTDLQKAAVAITAINADSLDQANVVDPIDLNGLVPSLVITASEGFNKSVAIRGIGFNVPQNDAAQPSVSYHIDGIYVANPVALDSGFLDVDHVEVLRGPQGTVFGQNSVGGTINVISKRRPSIPIPASPISSIGSYDLVHFRAALNVPVTIRWRSASIDQNRQDGYVNATKVPGTGGQYDLGNNDSVHARLQALWKPIDNLTILLRAEYADADNHESPGKSLSDPNPNPYEQTDDWPGKFLYRQELYSATVTYNFDWAVLKSLSSWQSVNQGGSVNEDGLDTQLMSPNHDVEWFLHKSNTITSEVDLNSVPGGPLDWVVGAFFLNVKEKVGYDQYLLSDTDQFDENLLHSAPLNYVPSNLYFQSDSLLTRQSWSLFGQGTYHITDDLRFTGGIRYTHDENSTNISDYFNLYGPPVYVQSSANSVTGMARFDYDLTPNNLVYVSFSTGFKPGGGNISLAPAVVPFEFKPETITAYEIGSKNSFMDNKIHFNTAAFYYQYDNMQYEAEDLIPFEGGVDNIPSVDIYGAEAEIQALLPYNLRFDGNLTIEHGRVTSHFKALDNVAADEADAEAGGPFVGDDLELRAKAYRDVYGNAPPFLPAVTAAGGLSHELAFADGSDLLTHVQVQYRDHYANAIFGNSSIYTAPSYWLTNVYFDYTLANPAWDVSFEVSNLFDHAYVISQFTNQFGGETTRLYGPPREFMARVAYKF